MSSMPVPGEPSPAPGYYPDPTTGVSRWWDGNTWGSFAPPTMVVAPQPVAVAATGAEPPSKGMLTAAYVFAIVMPIVGFVLGILLLTRRETAHGLGALVLSVVMACFWWGFGAGFAETYDPYATI